MTRCVPGDLAEIIRSEAGNEGRRVSVERRALDGPDGPEWRVLPLQPLRQVLRLGVFVIDVRIVTESGCFPDAWLRPIRDGLPPEASSTDRDIPADADAVAHA